MSHSIHPVTSTEDLPTIAKLIHASKLELTINRLLWKDWPNDVAQTPMYKNAIESSFKDPSSEIIKAVDQESGLIIGYIVLTHRKPGEAEKAVKNIAEAPEEVKIPEGMNSDVHATVMKFVKECDTQGGIERLSLTHIFIKPTYRRRGIGSQLVRLGIEKAQKAGLPLSVGLEPQAHEFFLSLGFKDTKFVDTDLRQWAPEYSGFGVFRFTGMVKYSQ